MDSIYILSFLSASKFACDLVYTKGVPYCCFIFYEGVRQNDGTITSYCETDAYLLNTYTTDDVIAKIDADTMQFTQK